MLFTGTKQPGRELVVSSRHLHSSMSQLRHHPCTSDLIININPHHQNLTITGAGDSNKDENNNGNVLGNGIYQEQGCRGGGLRGGGMNNNDNDQVGEEESGLITVAGGRKKRTWTAEEDEKLKRAVEEHGSGNWMIIERCSGLGRTSKSCRLRWTNHLRPNLKKGSFTETEEKTVVMLHQKYGNKWSFIASKLPGRTDNEVKNFWHGRLRRCRKQYLDIYPAPPPPIQGDTTFHLTTNNDNNNNNNHHHNSSIIRTGNNFHEHRESAVAICCTDYMNNNNNNNNKCNNNDHFVVVSSSYVNPESSSIIISCTTDKLPNHQNQIFLPHNHQQQESLPQSRFHSNNIVLHPTSALSIELPPQSQPLLGKFSSPEKQGSISPGQSSSVSSHKLQGGSSQFNSITTTNTTKGGGESPTESVVGHHHYLSAASHIPNIIPTIASPHSPLDLKVTTPPPSLPPPPPPPPPTTYHSYFKGNPSSSPTKLEIPAATSPALESLTEMWLNSTLELAKQPSYSSTDFELPPPPPHSQSNPSSSYFNRSIFFTPNNTELPSFQSLDNGNLQVQQLQQEVVTVNLHKMGNSENGGIQNNAHIIQEPNPKTDLLYPLTPLSQKHNLDENNTITTTEIFKNGKKNKDSESVFLNPNKRKESSFDCEGWETINSSSGSQVITKKNLQCRNRMVADKRIKTELLRGKISRREGFLAEISKTGVLLVEKAKKERLISKLLNQSSKQDILLTTQNPNSPENLQLGEISKIKEFLGDSLSIEDILTTHMCNLRDDEKSGEDTFLAVNSAVLEHQNLQENLLEKCSSESVFLNSYEQEEMHHDLDVLGTQIYGTDLLKTVVGGGGICNDELNSVQVPNLDQVFHEISGRDVLQPGGFGGLQNGQDAFMDPSLLSYAGGLYEGAADYLNKISFRREYSSKKEFTEQVDHVGCSQWGGADDQDVILDDSNWGDRRYIFGNMLPNSACLDNLDSSSCVKPSSSPAGFAMEDDGQRKEMISVNRKESEESSRNRSMGDSFVERVNGLQELSINDFLPLTNQNTTAYHMMSSDAQFSSSRFPTTGEEEEEEAQRNMQPEQLSGMLEFLPTILPEWNNFSHNNNYSTRSN